MVIEALVEKKVKEALQKLAPSVVPPTTCEIQKPCLKWVGGKTQILDAVLDRFPRTMVNYHEPFVGGGSVLLGLLSQKRAGLKTVTGTIYASDANPLLIALYTNLQTRLEDVLRELKALVAVYGGLKGTTVNRKPTTEEEANTSQESYYYWIRTSLNKLTKEEKQTPKGSAYFLFLNKTCFRGVYREGPNGFNVPFGNYKNPGILDEPHLRALSALLQGVVFTTQPFQESLKRVSKGDFVYLDPPYAPESETSFVSYTADGFDVKQHKALFAACHDLPKQGAQFLMSNANVPFVKNAFPAPFQTHTLSCRRAIHSKTPDAKTMEVLIQS